MHLIRSQIIGYLQVPLIPPHLPSMMWAVWLQPVKAETKMLGSQVSCFFPESACIFASLPFITGLKIFLLSLISLAGFCYNFNRALVLLTWSLADWTMSLYFFQVISLFPPCIGFLFVFVQEHLVYPHSLCGHFTWLCWSILLLRLDEVILEY